LRDALSALSSCTKGNSDHVILEAEPSRSVLRLRGIYAALAAVAKALVPFRQCLEIIASSPSRAARSRCSTHRSLIEAFRFSEAQGTASRCLAAKHPSCTIGSDGFFERKRRMAEWPIRFDGFVAAKRPRLKTGRVGLPAGGCNGPSHGTIVVVTKSHNKANPINAL